jgi:hypothetical protein
MLQSCDENWYVAEQIESREGQNVAKDKKKKKNGKKAKAAGTGTAGKAVKSLKALSQNPFVADIVAAALVGAAAALKDSKKAQRLASEAGDEIESMSRKGIQRGEALWDMALDIGRRSLEAFSEEVTPKRAKSKPAAKARPDKPQGTRKRAR